MSMRPTYLGQTPPPAPTPGPTATGAPPVSTHQPGPPVPGATPASSEWRKQAEEYLRGLGVDISGLEVQGALAVFDVSAPFFDQQPALFDVVLGGVVSELQSKGIIIQTLYQQAQELSGFGETKPVVMGATTPSEVRGVAPGVTTVPGLPIEQERTGWLQYPSGILVDPTAPLGSTNAVYFPAGSKAPGSFGYFQDAQGWSQEKINEWRARLVELGYLGKDAKKGAYDVQLQMALQKYHTIKYQNGGKELALEGTKAAEAGVTPFNFEQIQGQIRNDIRGQWQRIYGEDPTETELQEMQDFVINTSHKLYQRGQLAPSQAAAEAEERFVERLEQSPEAQFVIQNQEENTQLRDSILRAVMVAQGMS